MFFGHEPTNSDGPHQKPLMYDRTRLDDICNGNEELRRRILTEYLKTSSLLIDQLLAGARGGDRGEIERAAHSLKGSSRTVGASALADLCEAIEHDGHDARSTSVEVQEELARVTTAIESHLGVV